jgi:hypothetical protein
MLQLCVVYYFGQVKRLMKIPFLAWLIQGIPEITGAVFLAISLATCQINWRSTVKIGLALSPLIYGLRHLPFTVGVHPLLAIAFMSFFLVLLEKIEMKMAVIVSAVTFFLLLIFEFAFNTFIISSGLVTDAQINANVYLWIITGYPQIIYLFALALINNKYKLSQVIIRKLSNMSE